METNTLNNNDGDEDRNESHSGSEPVRKKTRVIKASEETTMGTNVCSVCLTHFADDVAEASVQNWIACTCGCWLHEDCVLITPEMISTSEEFVQNLFSRLYYSVTSGQR